MARRLRRIEESSIVHVYNQGVGGRNIIETEEDYRHLLFLVARAVWLKKIKVLAFCLMNTHYHLLVICLDGDLPSTMQYIQSNYSRHFNRTRNRIGPLVKSRYGSRVIKNSSYLHAAKAYIEMNPVVAGMVQAPEQHKYSSASFRQPYRDTPWLRGQERSIATIPMELRDSSPTELKELETIMLTRLESGRSHDAWPHVVDHNQEGLINWMREKSMMADGTQAALPICAAHHLTSEIESFVHELRRAAAVANKKTETLTQWCLCGLLCDVCGKSHQEISAQISRARGTVSSSVRQHRQLVDENDAYAALTAAIARAAFMRGPLRLYFGNNDILP